MENNLIKEEWINGTIMMSPRPQYNHMEIEGVLYSKLRDYFKGSCKVAMEAALFLTKENPAEIKKDIVKLRELIKSKGAELVPDIAVYCDKEQIFKRGFLGVPQLAIEVLSPSNSTDDTLKKFNIYQKFGVPEYWIVNPGTREVFIYNIQDNHYELKAECKFLEEEIKSNRFEDLVIDIKDIELLEEDEDDI